MVKVGGSAYDAPFAELVPIPHHLRSSGSAFFRDNKIDLWAVWKILSPNATLFAELQVHILSE